MKDYKNIVRSQEVEVNTLLQEKAIHGSSILPMSIYIDEFNKYSVPIVQQHWHKELQFAYILNGNVEYEICGKKIPLKQGDGLFINSNILHMSTTNIPDNTQMITILFDHSIFTGINQVGIENKYIFPVINCKKLQYLLLTEATPWHAEILEYIKKLIFAEENREFGYEMEQKNFLGELWLILIRNLKDTIFTNESTVMNADETRIKIMLQFIHENFGNNIALEDIASAANLSKSECCRCFKRMLKISPFEYLIQNRILTAAKLLISTDRTILDISESVGFNGLSYFYKTFKSLIGMTPTEFRENEKS